MQAEKITNSNADINSDPAVRPSPVQVRNGLTENPGYGSTDQFFPSHPDLIKRVSYPSLGRQPWLQIDERTNTGRRLNAWMIKQGWRVEPTMQLDGFDLIINLVVLGIAGRR